MTRLGAPFLLAVALAGTATLCACESAEARCARLQGAAEQAWGKYAGSLQTELESARSTRDAAKARLEGEVRTRLEGEARRHADQLHGAHKSSAWYRTFLAAEQAQCARSAECLELKVQVNQADARLTDLTPRLDAVRAAQDAVKGDADAARRAADAVPRDQRQADAEPARSASGEAITACAELER